MGGTRPLPWQEVAPPLHVALRGRRPWPGGAPRTRAYEASEDTLNRCVRVHKRVFLSRSFVFLCPLHRRLFRQIQLGAPPLWRLVPARARARTHVAPPKARIASLSGLNVCSFAAHSVDARAGRRRACGSAVRSHTQRKRIATRGRGSTLVRSPPTRPRACVYSPAVANSVRPRPCRGRIGWRRPAAR